MSKRGGRGKVSHKGRRRHFTDEEDLKHDLEKAKREKEWRESRGEVPSDEEKADHGSDNDSSSEEEEADKRKGVGALIEVENPNRAKQKMKKVTNINLDADSGTGSTTQLSRREREEIAKQQDKIRYQKLHAEGKTEQARADLARLAIIKKEREDAAKKRDEEKKAREMAAAAKARK